MARGSTLAERHFALLATHPFDELSDLVDGTGAVAALGEIRELWPRPADPAPGLLQECADSVLAALRALGEPAERLDSVVVGSTAQEDVSAQVSPFPDGSGLVLVADPILRLSQVYCRHLAGVFTDLRTGSLLRRVRKVWRMVASEDDAHLRLAGLLRFHHVHQRVFGLPGTMSQELAPEAVGVAAVLRVHAYRFLLAHEIAHHVLDHATKPRAYTTSERLPLCSDERGPELEADLLGLRAVLRAEADDGTEAPVLAALGALVAMLAVRSAEQALQVRPAIWHPDPAVRIRLLVDTLAAREAQTVRDLSASLTRATALASDFRTASPDEVWAQVVDVPGVATPHPAEHVRLVVDLDRVQCGTPKALRGLLGRLDPALVAGADLALSGDVPAGLRAWRVPTAEVTRICDPDRALSFHDLHATLFAALPADPRAPLARRLRAVAAAALAAHPLTTPPP